MQKRLASDQGVKILDQKNRGGVQRTPFPPPLRTRASLRVKGPLHLRRPSDACRKKNLSPELLTGREELGAKVF